MPEPRTVKAIRYITPLREGGSLPAVVEGDDGETYVMKFVGAGQGPKALIAELIGGQLAQLLRLQTPEIVFIEMDDALGRSEPDPEIQDLLQASVGLNLAMRFLPSALAYDSLLKPPLSPRLASDIVWFDSYVTNVDRTPRNVNMLIWEDSLWLIDHGAALYFHHDWGDYIERSRTPFSFVKQHALLPLATQLHKSDQRLRSMLSKDALAEIVGSVPDRWLRIESAFESPQAQRTAYVEYLLSRRDAADIFLEEAIHAHGQHV